MKQISSWGRLSVLPHEVIVLNERNLVPTILANQLPGIAHGMGRSYGDVCLNPKGTIWKTTGLDRFISFDQLTGRLVCESGVLLRDIQQLVIHYGWLLPVTPGTQLVTVGGAIANDVHGKNHHVSGSFSNHVEWLKLVRTDGEVVECSPQNYPDWFAATVGGLGLTGVITEVEIQLCPVPGPYLETETIPFKNLDEFFYLADSSEANWNYTVSWVDSISRHRGRGLFMRGNFTNTNSKDYQEIKNQKLTVPFVPPFSLINQLTLGPLNRGYFYLKKRGPKSAVVHYESFFYPLDNVQQWNQIYGPKGFYQYQFVVPRSVGQNAIQTILDEIVRSGEGSFLTVLKTFGNRSSIGMLSFPRPGVTLALDFPNKGTRTLKLLERFDSILRDIGGGIYLAKDARMPRELFELSYPRFNEFLAYRDRGISSGLSRRLMGY